MFFEGNPVLVEDSVIFKCINDLLNNSESIKKYFEIENINVLQRYRKLAIYNIFTMLSVIEEVEEGNSTLKKYFNEVFS